MHLLALLIAGPYNAALTLAIIVAFVFALRAGRHAGVPLGRLAAVLMTALAAGYVGSRTIFLDFEPIGPAEKTNLGALLLGIPAIVLTARALGLGAWRSLDLVTRPTLVAMAIGRVGCFVAKCCAGTETSLPWAVADRDGHLVHPVQLYEAVADVALLLLLGRRSRDGTRFLAATLGYTAIRFAAEFVRAGRVRHGGLDPVQWSLLVIAAVLVSIVLARRRDAEGARPDASRARGMTGAVRRPAIAWRAIPLAVVPQIGAFFMMQAPTTEDPPQREVLVGGAVWRAMYDQTLGYEYATDCDGSPTRWPTLASRDAESTEGMIGYRFRTSAGDRITVEARYQSGRDRIGSIDSGPTTVVPTNFTTHAVGGAVTLERPLYTARFGLMGGTLGNAGVESRGLAPTMLLRFGDDQRWYGEANLADRSRFGATGEFSYMGVGYTLGRDRPRAMLGLGEGGKAQLFVPMAGFEIDLSYGTLSTRDDGSNGGEGWRIGVQRGVRVR